MSMLGNCSKQTWQRTEMSLTSILCVLIFHAFQCSTCFRVSVTSFIICAHLFLLSNCLLHSISTVQSIWSILILAHLFGSNTLLSTIKSTSRWSNKTYTPFPSRLKADVLSRISSLNISHHRFIYRQTNIYLHDYIYIYKKHIHKHTSTSRYRYIYIYKYIYTHTHMYMWKYINIKYMQRNKISHNIIV